MTDQGRIDGRTKLIGLTATPIGHSLSPAMHNMSFRELGLNYVYMAFEVDNKQLEDVVTGFRALNLRGFNVSMPNKTKILPLLDELTDGARFAGAVNTVLNDNGKLIGYNTDGIGYFRSLKENHIDVKGKKITLLGAGGAATAIAIQAALEGVKEISIFNRDDEYFNRAENNTVIINEKMEGDCIANVYRLEDKKTLKEEIAASDILTNATGVGMKPLEGQALVPDLSWLRPELIVSDVVYIPRKTKLLGMAATVGCQAINGLGMMLWQGAAAFELWTGQEMPVEYVKNQMF
ncbi:shikimate dehydrogenase (NADP(+)) [Oceanobacillus oncorhynchi subsp. incaldanensis]|uniref:shikimate dehydrogenase n=1 Tax=Oceanobacillus oncorhynchi TaxID=545501 RepID=UPI001B06EF50|nr:shikimate dehydrogenase [Oceanobacillus oncorhynchi]GIO18616.1 shikimate dehydrogenase (NADP(+)) [Oceanobacillus oncorhynchi subsp. incaldanensis]